ncbi:MAG: hypothetical protein JRI68_16530 [Deltaproteobacteria bacterium]|nr:hypothetical protein [Deltaproteobacteria bacterium]
MTTKWLGWWAAALIVACGSGDDDWTPETSSSSSSGSGGGSSSSGSSGTAGGPAADCGSVRMTYYGATDRRWCGFDRTHPLLPEFVRQGMTVAVAEPYNGSSYEGDPGEACGECWELDTTFGTEIVMVHDLCPIEGNPICAGSHFHFDVSGEVAAAVDGGGWLGEGAVRRVPCPVTGNIHATISDRNQWGYLKVAFFNHRFPIRSVEYRPTGADSWLPMERCLARWCEAEDMDTFADGGPGAVFRLTSAAGETVEGTEVLTDGVAVEADFDTGIQFAPVEPPTDSCQFVPPGDVYDEQWGGIDGVRWEPNTWGDTNLSEVANVCAEDSASCLRLGNFAGSGLHITYRHVFPTTTFAQLTLRLRAASGSGQVDVAPRSEESRCANTTTADVGPDWTTVTIDVAASCTDTDWVQGLTISQASGPMDLMVDEIRFQ